jgi:hypothetical protein
MSGEELVKLRLAYPFRAFTLVMRDGRRLPVNRAPAIAISPDRRGVVYAMADGGFDWFKVTEVSAVEMDQTPASAVAGEPT